MTLDSLLTVLVSGVVLGSLYALMASGLSLVWNTLGIFNFAHGVFMTIGAYVAWQISDVAGFGLDLSLAISIAVVVLLGIGVVFERSLVRPFYGERDILLITVMTTLAAMVFLEKGVKLIWGPRLKQIEPMIEGDVQVLNTIISGQEALAIVLSPAILFALWLFLKYARWGRGIRAVGQNPAAARLIGVNVSVMFMVTFALSAALAAFTGIMLGSIRFVTPTMGAEPLVKALIVVIFGGLGSLAGTVVSAYFIGILEAFLIFGIGLYWTPAVLFIVMISVLVWRPSGLMGKPQ